MRMKETAKKFVGSMLVPFGLEIRRIRPESPPIIGIPSCEERLRHIKKLGFLPRVIYDCGAFIGSWAASVSELFPQVDMVLIEPNVEMLVEIEKNTERIKQRITVVNAAVSDKPGKGRLNVWHNPGHKDKFTALAASSLLDHVQGQPAKRIDIDIKMLDTIAEETKKLPDLLKLDLQGGEKNALLGAKNVLNAVEVCIVEFGCLDAYVDRTTPQDLMEIMYESGFCLYDIVDLRYRPYDGALVGGDFFFVKRSSPLKEHKDYF